jgi:hypothetical protein
LNVATRVYAVSGIALNDALWNIPAALSYQLQIIFLQRQGFVFKRDTRAELMEQLSI